MKAPGVLCCGNIVYDTLAKPVDELHWNHGTTFVESIDYRCGGNGASTSRTLGILGVPVRLISAVGSDEQGGVALDAIRSAQVDITHVARVASPTAATVVLINSAGDRKFFHRPGASEEAFTNEIRFTSELCAGMSHFHLASFFVLPKLRARGANVLIRAREAGLSTSFDTNWDPQGEWMNTLETCFPHIDLFFTNEDEVRMLSGHADPESAAATLLDKGVPVCIVKLGWRGCAVFTKGDKIICPAFEVEAKDTTGAGDCFAGGFLAAWQRGASLADAGRFANAVAALSVQNVGAVVGVLPLCETEAWMRNTPLRQVSPNV